jgi:VWFA-related protein
MRKQDFVAAILAAALISFAPAPAASAAARGPRRQEKQDQPVRLKAELIELRAVVTDKQGRPVVDLTKEDFELSEDGTRQQISFFSTERVEAAGADPAAGLRVDGAGAAPTAAVKKAARAVVLFVDNLHISPPNLSRVKQSLKKFIRETLAPGDLVAVVATNSTSGLLGQFTRDRAILDLAIDALTRQTPARASLFTPYLASMVVHGSREAMALAAQILTEEDGRPLVVFDEPPPAGDPKVLKEKGDMFYIRSRAERVLSEEAMKRKATLVTIRAVAARLTGMPGQRMIALFSEGFTMKDAAGGVDTADVRAAVDGAVRSGALIYSIDVMGLEPNPMFDASNIQSFDENMGMRGSRPKAYTYHQEAEKDRRDAIHALAKDTGGDVFFDTNDMAGALRQALDENRFFYVLGYYPAEEGDRRFRRVALRVKGHPEYTVRTQKGYMPSDKSPGGTPLTPAEKLSQSIYGALPASAIPVVASADYFEGEGDAAQVSLVAHISGGALKYEEQNKRFSSPLQVATVALDRAGKTGHRAVESVRPSLSAERLEVAKGRGFRLTKRLSLKPGLYQLRVGVLEESTENIGTAFAWIEVPDLSRGKLAMSSLFLKEDLNQERKAEVADKASEQARSRLSPLVGAYRSGQFLVYYFTLYNAAPAAADDDLLMQLEIIQNDRAIYQSPWQPASRWVVKKGGKGIDLGGQMKLGLKAGLYELRVSVKQSRTKQTAQRSVVFEVEP